MATIDRYVDPDAAGAANGTSWADAYTSLNSCEAAQQQDLTDGGGDVMVIHCRCSGGTADSTSLDINGWTAAAASYIQIIVEDGYRHQAVRPTGNIYRLTGATAWDRTLTVNESFVYLDYLAITKTTTDGTYPTMELYPDVASARVRTLHCLVYDGNGIGVELSSGAAGAQISIINGFIYRTGSHGIRCSDEAGWDAAGRIYNCTIGNAGDDGIFSVRGSHLAKNCYVGGSTNEDYDIDNATLTMTTCYDEDGTGDTTSAFSTSAGAYFVNVTAGSEDLTIGSASSELIGNGTDLSGDGDYPFSTDWEDEDRSDWDVGADEYVASGTTYYQSLAGAFSFTGGLAKSAQKALAGSLSFLGTAAKQTNKQAAGILSFTGSASKRTSKSLTGAFSFTGAATKITGKSLAGSFSFSGVVAKVTVKALAGAVSFSGTVARITQKVLAGAFSFSGALSATTLHMYYQAVGGVIAFTGGVQKVTAKGLQGALTFAGNVAKLTQRALAGVLSFTGGVAKVASKLLSGVLGFSGSLSTSTGPASVVLETVELHGSFGAAVSMVGTISSASISCLGSFGRMVSLKGELN